MIEEKLRIWYQRESNKTQIDFLLKINNGGILGEIIKNCGDYFIKNMFKN